MKRKCLAVGIILLFVGTCIIPAIAQDADKPLTSSKGNWLYVGGSGPGNYTRIQNAIDNASDGDTVFVYDDSSPYHEHLTVIKSISLIGENKNTTIIDGDGVGDVVFVSKSYVTIHGFQIQNSGNASWKENAGIFINFTNSNSIVGNVIVDNTYGIVCDYSGYTNISDNIVSYNWRGIFLDSSFNSKIYGNVIKENGLEGIFVGSTTLPSERTVCPIEMYMFDEIKKNTITKNDFGILLSPASSVTIIENNITDNKYGIFLHTPFLCNSDHNTISQNSIMNNTYGIFAGNDLGTLDGNTISRNNIINNKEGIIFTFLGYGLLQTRMRNNEVSYNNFIGNSNTVTYDYSLVNHWIGNYWGKTRLFPFPLIGKVRVFNLSIPWVTFDWHPAQQPYNISGMR